jgi:hypothetical protein
LGWWALTMPGKCRSESPPSETRIPIETGQGRMSTTSTIAGCNNARLIVATLRHGWPNQAHSHPAVHLPLSGAPGLRLPKSTPDGRLTNEPCRSRRRDRSCTQQLPATLSAAGGGGACAVAVVGAWRWQSELAVPHRWTIGQIHTDRWAPPLADSPCMHESGIQSVQPCKQPPTLSTLY